MACLCFSLVISVLMHILMQAAGIYLQKCAMRMNNSSCIFRNESMSLCIIIFSECTNIVCAHIFLMQLYCCLSAQPISFSFCFSVFLSFGIQALWLAFWLIIRAIFVYLIGGHKMWVILIKLPCLSQICGSACSEPASSSWCASLHPWPCVFSAVSLLCIGPALVSLPIKRFL